jgi:hypothetical protein
MIYTPFAAHSFTTSSLSVGTHTISFKVLDNSNSWSVVVSSAVTVTPKVAKPVIKRKKRTECQTP